MGGGQKMILNKFIPPIYRQKVQIEYIKPPHMGVCSTKRAVCNKSLPYTDEVAGSSPVPPILRLSRSGCDVQSDVI